MPRIIEPKTKYSVIAGHFREQIRKGILRPGERLPSRNEMRERFGATQGTLDKVHDILEREGLIQREARRGIFVAEPETRVQQHVIGMMFWTDNDNDHPYWTLLLHGARRQAHETGREVLFLHPKSPEVHWEKVDGVLVVESEMAQSNKQLPLGMPCVSLIESMPGLACVTADDIGGGELATRHLLELGHRRIAYLMGGPTAVSERRLVGYKTALRAAGVTPNARWQRFLEVPLPDNSHRLAGRNAMEKWLREDWKKLGCTAIICQNDDSAHGVLDALREADLNVPNDVSVVGYDGTKLSEYSYPQLTTIRVPLEEISRRGVQLLETSLSNSMMENPPLETVVLPVELKLGQSSGPASVPKIGI